MADNKFRIWASLEVDNNQIKTEFTKAWELAGKSVGEWIENQKDDVIEKLWAIVDEMRTKIQTLQEMDFSLLDPEKTEEDMQFLQSELDSLDYRLQNIQRGSWRQDFWEEWRQAFEDVKTTTEEYRDTLYSAMDQVQLAGEKVGEAMDEAEEQTNEATEAVKNLNDEANKGISENWGLWKMFKFLASKEIINFFYRNIKMIWEKLIELSGDSEMLTQKFEWVKQKFMDLWGYIGKGLTPALEWVIEDADQMATELTEAGSAGQNSASVIQKWVFIVATAFRGLIKIIRSFGIFLGSVFWWLRPVVSWFFTDLYDTAVSVIKWIWNVDNWKALWNNIKYWVVQWVNGAIESVNGMLNWLRDKLGIDLWNISTFDAWQKMEYNFGDLSLKNTKDAVKAFNQTMEAGMEDVWKDRADFFNDTKNWRKSLENTAITSTNNIAGKTKSKIWGGSWGWNKDSVKGAYEEMEEEAEDLRKEMDNLVSEHQKKYDDLIKNIEKLWEQYDKLRDEAKKTREDAEKSLKNYNEELEKAQGEAITDLGQRYVELRKELMWVDEYMKKRAQELSRKEIQTYQDWWYTEYSWYELKDLIELKEKLEEMQLIEENTTEEQRKSQEFLKETSKSQEILNKLKEQEAEIEEKKATALEKQAIAQAVMNQEDWKQYIKTLTKDGEDIWTRYYDTINEKREQIRSVENVEYAKQLENQTTNLNEQLKQFTDEKNEEVEILIDLTARKISLENEYDKVFKTAMDNQKKSVNELIQKWETLIAKKNEYYWSDGGGRAYGWSVMEWQVSVVGENGPEQIIARQSSYVQPRNAGNSYNTTNTTTNSLNIAWIEINYDNIDNMLEWLKEKLTYRD